MKETIKRNNKIICLGRLFCLVFAMAAAAVWADVGYSKDTILGMNASGNLNIAPSVDPISKSKGFSSVLYDNLNGLPTSEANAIAQTGNGFIWIGSYAGLIRYDGNTFERFDSTTGIANVRCLYVDSQDRLWIGTNDSGVFLMSGEELRNWDKTTGLGSDSVRAISENSDGLLYIAGISGIVTIDADLKVSAITDERLVGQTIRDLRRGVDGLLYGLTYDGDLFTVKDGKVLTFLSHDECRVKGILALLPDPSRPGVLYLGTEESWIYYGSLENNFSSLGMKSVAPLSYVERFEYIDGEIWICAGNGAGNLDAEGFHLLKNVSIDSSVGHVMTDQEGNLWFTSTRQGVMKIVYNQFSDIFNQYNLPASVVNSTCMYGRQLFIGTDTGLIVIDSRKQADEIPLNSAVTASGKELGTTDLLKYLDGVRIRSIFKDSKDRLWISTWHKYGLLRYEKGKVTAFTTEDGLLSDYVRMVTECEDGSILVVNSGLSVIQDDIVTAGYGEEDGSPIKDILTVAEGYNHDLILGSDGGGIFIIGSEGIRHIGTDEGLNSEIILRIKRSRNQDVYWVITGNSLAYMTPDYQVTTVNQFPYSNNYDLYENSQGDAWVLSSSGIYVTPTEDLLANGPIDPVFYGIYSGLPYISTSNSYSDLTADGDLYIASMSGTVKVNIEKPYTNFVDLKIGLPFIDADGKRYYPDSSGNFTLPGNVRKLTIYPYVFNYSLIDPQISYRLEDFDSADTTVSRRDLQPVDYTNLPVSTYHFTITARDLVGHTNKTMSFQIIKGKASFYEAAGSIIMNIAALFLMGGILIYSSLFRKRGRTDDKLFFAMILSNTVLAAANGMSCLLEGSAIPFARELMTAANIVFYICLVLFPCLFLLYFDYYIYRDDVRLKKMIIPAGIPCILLLIFLIINQMTGWFFTVGEDNILLFGHLHNLIYIPAVFCFLISMTRVSKISALLVLICLLLLIVRAGLGIWFQGISSTAFIYALFLVSIYIHLMNQPLVEETP